MLNTLLIVDDSLTARSYIKRCCEVAGYKDSEYLEAGNGEEALCILEKNKVDLLITDLNMPKMNGKSLIKYMKSSMRFNEIPVVVISSTADNVKKDELISNGATEVISKPLSPMVLAKIIDKINCNG